MPDLLIYYKTTWSPAILHYGRIYYDNSESSWEDSIGQDCDSLDQPGWQRFCLADVDVGIRFVLCNYTKTQYDHAPASRYALGSKNYEIRVPRDAAPDTCLYYTLYEGEITSLQGPPVCIITDLDGTLLGNSHALALFNRYWEKSHLFKGSVLVYSTGRNLKDFLRAAHEHRLLKPTLAICGVGTEIYAFKAINPTVISTNSHIDRLEIQAYLDAGYPLDFFDASIQDNDFEGPDWCPERLHAIIDMEWEAVMRESFDRIKVERYIKEIFPNIKVSGSPYHDPFRLAINIRRCDLACGGTHDLVTHIQNINRALKDFNVLLSGEGEVRHLDILPKLGGKRAPIEYLVRKHGIASELILVCGDSGNDVDMFTLENIKGCCVGNAQSDFKALLLGQIAVQVNPLDEWSVAQHLLYENKIVPPSTKIHFSVYPHAAAILDSLRAFKFEEADVIQHILDHVSF